MRKQKLAKLSTENLKELKRKTLIALWVTILISIAVILKLISAIKSVEIGLIHMIVAGAVIGAIIELFINSILINTELKARDKSKSDDQTVG